MVAEPVTTTNSTCDGRRPKNRSRPHQAAHGKMLKESPKDKQTNQLEQNTVEVPQVQNEQGHREDDTDFPVPQTTEEVADLSATVEQSNNAVTENTAQQMRDRTINEQTVASAKYITKMNDSGVDKAMT